MKKKKKQLELCRADIGSHLELIVTSLIYAKLKKLESKLFERERER